MGSEFGQAPVRKEKTCCHSTTPSFPNPSLSRQQVRDLNLPPEISSQHIRLPHPHLRADPLQPPHDPLARLPTQRRGPRRRLRGDVQRPQQADASRRAAGAQQVGDAGADAVDVEEDGGA